MNNPDIKILKTEVLSKNWATLSKITLEYIDHNTKENQVREVYNRGNGATILLYNENSKTVILTRQFRLPTYLAGNKSGMLIETCAGTLEDENPLEAIIRETEEETGYKIYDAKKIFEAYMSPGSVTEIIHFFAAKYDQSMKISEGGGLVTEHEHIQVMEVRFADALRMIDSGEIKDAKTIMLLQYACINIPKLM